MNELPNGWRAVRLDEIGDVRLGRQRSPARATGPHMRPYMRAANVGWDGLRLDDVKEMDFDPKEFETYRLRDGDILVGEASGSRHEVGKSAVWRGQVPGACFQNTLIRVRVRDDDPDYVQQHLKFDALRGALADVSRGVGIHHLGREGLANWTIGLPPRDQQRRIVEKIEALTVKSRLAEEALEAIPPLLERFRQSVLAAAFRGDLTRDWRKQNPDVEPAHQLLVRIREERRTRWEQAETERLRAKGKTLTNDEWKKKYVESAPVDAEDLPELPVGWCWASLDELVYDGPRNGYSPQCSDDGSGPLVLKLSATTQGSMLLSSTVVKRATHAVDPALDCWLSDGDVLIQRANTLELVGSTAIYRGPSRTYVYPDLMMRVRIADDALRSLVWRYMNGRAARMYLQARATGTAGNMPKINGATVRSVPVPVPPPLERSLLVRQLEASLTGAEAIEGAVKAALSRHASIDQSILARAFRGELVGSTV